MPGQLIEALSTVLLLGASLGVVYVCVPKYWRSVMNDSPGPSPGLAGLSRKAKPAERGVGVSISTPAPGQLKVEPAGIDQFKILGEPWPCQNCTEETTGTVQSDRVLCSWACEQEYYRDYIASVGYDDNGVVI